MDLTRSRAYKKNDNCYVEQKNGTHARDTFGYERFDEEVLLKYMNEIYTNYQNILFNFFIPQLKMTKKYREGAKYRRFYDAPKTPYQRLMESKHVPLNKKADLKRVYDQLNPIVLRREMSRKISEFKKIAKSLKNKELGYLLA